MKRRSASTGRIARWSPLHPAKTAWTAQRIAGRAGSTAPLRTGCQTTRGTPSGRRAPTGDLRSGRVDSSEADLDLALGTTQWHDPSARGSLASQNSEFRQVPYGSRHAGAAFQGLLQPMPEARHVEGQKACPNRGLDRSFLDAPGIANLRRCSCFQNPVGSTTCNS